MKEYDEFMHNNWSVAAPQYLGAPIPDFDPKKVNEREFAHSMRFKFFSWDTDVDGIKIKWTTQERGDEHEVNTLLEEIKRWANETNCPAPVWVMVNTRDGDVLNEGYKVH